MNVEFYLISSCAVLCWQGDVCESRCKRSFDCTHTNKELTKTKVVKILFLCPFFIDNLEKELLYDTL